MEGEQSKSQGLPQMVPSFHVGFLVGKHVGKVGLL